MKSRLPLILSVCCVLMAGGVRAQRADIDPRITKLLASIDEKRMQALLTKLVSVGTRNTLSSGDSPTRGIGAARQWIFDELQRTSPKLHVSFDTHLIAAQGRIPRDVELRNVMAVLPGKSPRRIYVCGHYDSLNLGERRPFTGNAPGAPPPAGSGAQQPRPPQDFNIDAPGANDDGSGTVLTMELARVFAESGIELDATLVFIVWAGEEQGLIGSKAHVQKAAAEHAVIDAVFNNDIVGNIQGGNGQVDGETIRVYSEGAEDSPSRALARFIQRHAARYVPSHRVRLMARHDRFGRGSDHSSFNQSGYAAVVFREANENYFRQHSAHDTLEGMSFPYLAQNARVNAAGVATIALAPPAPQVTDARAQPTIGRQPSGYDANLRWQASSGAAGYKVFWRDAWTPDWQHEMAVGNVTQVVLPNVSIDDYVFGVAAVGADGHESLVAAYVNPARADVPVKLVK